MEIKHEKQAIRAMAREASVNLEKAHRIEFNKSSSTIINTFYSFLFTCHFNILTSRTLGFIRKWIVRNSAYFRLESGRNYWLDKINIFNQMLLFVSALQLSFKNPICTQIYIENKLWNYQVLCGIQLQNNWSVLFDWLKCTEIYPI